MFGGERKERKSIKLLCELAEVPMCIPKRGHLGSSALTMLALKGGVELAICLGVWLILPLASIIWRGVRQHVIAYV